MGGSSGKSDKKKSEPAAPSVATNPNFIPMQQPQPFAPGMQDALAGQLATGFGSPGLLGSGAADFNGLLNSIYNPTTPAQAADPIGSAQDEAAVRAYIDANQGIGRGKNKYGAEDMQRARAAMAGGGLLSATPAAPAVADPNAAPRGRDMYGGNR